MLLTLEMCWSTFSSDPIHVPISDTNSKMFFVIIIVIIFVVLPIHPSSITNCKVKQSWSKSSTAPLI